MNNNLLAIINYKNSFDTINCINSIIQLDPGAGDILVVDNASTGMLASDIRSAGLEPCCEIIENANNRGFSSAANQCARIAHERGYKYVTLVNNDTWIRQRAVSELKNSAEQNLDRAVLGFIPVIVYAHDPKTVWNAGGHISALGFRRCPTSGRDVSGLATAPVFYSYATGCFILLNVEAFLDIGMFDERFFFGEDDFNLALRMLRGKKKYQLVKSSVVVHKVGASINNVLNDSMSKIYLYYLNRFIDIKLVRGNLYFLLFATLNIIYINLFILRFNIGWKSRLKFFGKLILESIKRNSTPAEVFERLKSEQW